MKPEIRSYLNRIGYPTEPGIEPRCDFSTLSQLQSRHLQTVPYENLDIMRDIPLSLEIDDMYEKIVVRGRGGYCFELNGLFAWLLREMGFGVVEYMARYLRDEPEIPMRRHRVLKVTCGETAYLCDVGVGAIIPREPIPIVTGQVIEQNFAGTERYKLEKEHFLGYVLYEWKKDSWQKVYSFTEEEQLNIDYVMPSFYCEKHPESFFRTMDMVHIFTDNGRKSVSTGEYGRELKIFSTKGVEVIVPATDTIYHELLQVHFGITI